MTELITFYNQHGLALTLIAIAGIAILGALKYAEVFKKLEEEIRHLVYIAISVGLSLTGGAVYLIVIGSFEINSFFVFAASMFALNQMFYNIFKATTFNDLVKKILNKIIEFFQKNSN